MKYQIFSRYDSTRVVYECDLPDDTPSGMATRMALEKAVSFGANLAGIKNDFWAVLFNAPREVAGLRLALIDGRVDGSSYEGACACLVGTIANVRGLPYRDIGIKPDSSRPAERWFLAIRNGDTPKTNQISKITVEWLDEFVGLLEIAKA